MRKNIGKIKLILMGLFLLTGAGCDQPLFKNDLEAIKARGVLKIITRNNAACFYEGPHGPEGFEYDLSKAFSNYLGVKLETALIDDNETMISELLNGNADLIAAEFIINNDLRRYLTFGPPYQKTKALVVGRSDGPTPKSLTDLADQTIWVKAGSFYEKHLKDLKNKHPQLTWLAVSDYESEELLAMTWQGIITLTISDSNTFAINRRYYPELTPLFVFGQEHDLAWVMHRQNKHLQHAVNAWFSLPSTTTLLDQLTQHYYGHLQNFDYVDIKKFRRRLRRRLPRYRKYFVLAGSKYKLDWRLIAAQAYQESYWNPRAKSFTGVRGMMMITLNTARDLGIKNRLDPKQSISAGTRYLSSLHKRIGNDVDEPDRTFMALAAYNVGLGHLKDAQKLAVRLKRDPNTWSDIRSTLPLLRLKKYYRKLPHGYARGNEPVKYVDRIRTYYKILILEDKKSKKTEPQP
jgi:membrane-bound lytic murein transglycosylase F